MKAAREIKRNALPAKIKYNPILGANTPKSKQALQLLILSGGETY
jgi:hypothetical protein